MLFCGDSTTHEIYEIIHNRHQSLTTKNIYGDVNRPTCFEETPDVFVTGGCGSNSAQVSARVTLVVRNGVPGYHNRRFVKETPVVFVSGK